MQETARNAIPTNGIMNTTGFPCHEYYVTKSLILTERKNDSTSVPVTLSEVLHFAQGDKRDAQDDTSWFCHAER
jgi:hypothetical protein